jgi:hypothetical protein
MANGSGFYASRLRLELSLRNREYARDLPHVESYGEVPVVVYSPAEQDWKHGNFFDDSYQAICSRPEWHARFGKAHSQAKRALPRAQRQWRELDSSCSSDALLMNIFCCPEVWESQAVLDTLGVEQGSVPQFGFKARVPLQSGHMDRTEVDMKFGSLLVESKLTESDFQSKPVAVLESYKDFQEVFDQDSLSRTENKYRSYQLLRNVLAAHTLDCSFCVLHDTRRPDLREEWFSVMSAIKIPSLATRCKVLTWQELAKHLSPALQRWLDLKYGIVQPGATPSEIANWQSTT